MMKAVVVNSYGGPEVLSYQDVPDPTPGPDEVLIRTEAISVNYADIKARRGVDSVHHVPPFISGLEAAGTIAALGETVHDFEVGQRVVALPNSGAYAELAVAPAHLTFPLPDEVAFESTAGIISFITAFNVLTLAGRLSPGESVLIHAAAGGAGIAAVQFAKLLGAGRVIGTVGSDEKAELVSNLGADHVINYRTEDFATRVLEITDNSRVDLIIDSVAGSTFEAGLSCLAPFGRIVVFGHTSGRPGNVQTNVLQIENRAVVGYRGRAYLERRPEVMTRAGNAVLEYLATGKVQPVIGERFLLGDAAASHRLVESRRSVGKVLLFPEDSETGLNLAQEKRIGART